MQPRKRIILLLLRILAHPYRFRRRELWEGLEEGTKEKIDSDIEIFRDIGFHFEQDKHYRCAILPEKGFKELEHLQSLTESDRSKIAAALQYVSTKDALYLNRKLSTLYDFQQLGLRALRRPSLDKIDLLNAAKNQEQQVILKNYHSNSNKIGDRLAEVFHIDPELDMIQAFDPHQKESRHFKLSRIERVVQNNTLWEYKNKHQFNHPDVFRIANNDQVMVHLQLDVYAFNALMDAYPKARGETFPGAAPNTFYFQAKVNAKFLGVSNFIMSNAAHVEILNPPELKALVRAKATAILEKFKED
jgi:predicted DNA-binding transcriptional regulator YafY